MVSDVAAQRLAAGSRRVITAQLLITLVVAGAFFVKSSLDGVSAIAGGAIGLITTLILWGSMNWSSSVSLRNPSVSQIILYISAAFRFLMVLIMFIICLKVFELAPLAVVVGFCLAQLAYLANMRG